MPRVPLRVTSWGPLPHLETHWGLPVGVHCCMWVPAKGCQRGCAAAPGGQPGFVGRGVLKCLETREHQGLSTTAPRGLLGVAGGYALPHPEACHWLSSGLCQST